MKLFELLLISIGLSMDASSVAVAKGLCMKYMSWYKAIIIGMWFATFQLLMPIIGYNFSKILGNNIKIYSHIIALVLLVLLGINMIREARDEYNDISDDISFKSMIIPSVATSIDALTVGITFSLLDVNIYISSIIIFITTFILSIISVRIGNIFGIKYKSRAQIVGGIILIIMGIKMVL